MGHSRGIIILILTVGLISFLVACGGGNSSGGNGGARSEPEPACGAHRPGRNCRRSSGRPQLERKRRRYQLSREARDCERRPLHAGCRAERSQLFRYRFDRQHEVLLRGDGGELQRRERKFQRGERDADCAPAWWGDLIVCPCDGRRAGEPACDQPVRVWRQFPVEYGLRYRFRSDLRTLGRQCQHALQLAELRNQCCSRLVLPESADGERAAVFGFDCSS